MLLEALTGVMSSVEIGITGASEGTLSVSIDYRLETSALVRKWRADRSVVDGLAADIRDAVGEAFADPPGDAGPGERGREIVERLRSLGLALYQEMLKDECDGLRKWGEAAGAGYLVFKIDKALAYLPLEMMYDGDQFVSRRFALGRVLYAEDARAAPPAPVAQANAAVLVGDPSEDPAIRADVEREIDSVRSLLRRGGLALKIALGHEGDLKYILANLPGTAIFHFSGHGVVGEDEHSTGLRLGQGAVLGGYSLKGLQAAPAFAFLNVCTPASAETWKGSIGIVEALLGRGTRACVASLWDISSKAAATLPASVYEHLLGGATFGEALREARCAAAETFGLYDPTWASYALYGDPRLTLPDAGVEVESRPARRLAGNRLILVAALIGLASAVLIPIATIRETAREESPEAQGSEPDSAVAPAAVAVGYLLVESTPRDARILIDGKPAGMTPYAVEVPVGSHTVILEKDGYRRWEASVEVREYPKVNLKADLEKTR